MSYFKIRKLWMIKRQVCSIYEAYVASEKMVHKSSKTTNELHMCHYPNLNPNLKPKADS